MGLKPKKAGMAKPKRMKPGMIKGTAKKGLMCKAGGPTKPKK